MLSLGITFDDLVNAGANPHDREKLKELMHGGPDASARHDTVSRQPNRRRWIAGDVDLTLQ
jgi:hypothetical protein